MRTKMKLLGLILLLLCSCSTSKYFLPDYKNIDVNEYGSYVRIQTHNCGLIDGELIAVDQNSLFVLSGSVYITDTCIIVPVREISSYTLRYARPKHYGWTIAAFSVFCISHGFWAALSFPVNLITTIGVTVSGENAYRYTNKNLSYEDLKMFARFPQGIPPEIPLHRIR